MKQVEQRLNLSVEYHYFTTSKFSGDKNSLINKEAADFGDYE